MRFGHFTAMALIATLHLIIPLLLILWTWGRSYTSITALGVQLLVLGSYTAFIFLMGWWVFASFYLRYVILILAIVAVIRSLMRIASLPFYVTPHFPGWAGYGAGVIIAAV